ncbi:MAG TPA: dTMP kinase [Planctomycetota bacterium]|nr:dTMP kinase [Planctomycetota bacterium]
MLIVFEGIDGTGKTTLAKRLAESLRATGLDVVETREPWTSRHGKELARLLAQKERTSTREQELRLFHADRAEHVAQVVRPALARGAWVVQDRTFWSTAAYQGRPRADATDESPLTLEAIVARSLEIAPKPDLTLLLLLAPEQALARIAKGRAATTSFEKLVTLQAVDCNYRHLARGERSIVPIETDRPVDEVWQQVERTCRERVGKP